jgi:hypothetical protein
LTYKSDKMLYDFNNYKDICGTNFYNMYSNILKYAILGEDGWCLFIESFNDR